jgi:hypothetical protein
LIDPISNDNLATATFLDRQLDHPFGSVIVGELELEVWSFNTLKSPNDSIYA